ncbi:putative N6-adenine methyltransferase-domain-containing protein [Xylaria bambusicola]|uniref:putative N6-adenine methyltransferase-domain-containing protein n=1 Tax=Xylaria bambusicola TaxID=326684 RepID=UPI002007DF1B|nr:putative N6-adenine methyltransferase-domain-containing protein [Xylaria bambusicola]KAI0503331.1 putative N6-adenine methyltransferase-domain-containing protein [Xylaria bambusicola]
MTGDTEESLTLSPDALAALTQFYAERDAQTEKFEKLRARAEADEGARGQVVNEPEPAAGELSIHTFTEDWNESQFWYSDETANLLGHQLLIGTSDDSVVAVVSTPSVFVALRKITTAAGYTGPKPKMFLLEHDYRFAVFPEFVFYDFAEPFKLPTHLKGAVDRMICDPPFLSEDCQTKMAMTLRWLARTKTGAVSTAETKTFPRVLICTGERMEKLVNRLYKPLNVATTTYEPVHSGLKNEFRCYANFECDAWRWQKEA